MSLWVNVNGSGVDYDEDDNSNIISCIQNNVIFFATGSVADNNSDIIHLPHKHNLKKLLQCHMPQNFKLHLTVNSNDVIIMWLYMWPSTFYHLALKVE